MNYGEEVYGEWKVETTVGCETQMTRTRETVR